MSKTQASTPSISAVLWPSLVERVGDSSLSLQGRIRQMLVSAILSSHLPPGSPVPSSRQLADSLGIARNTVVFAYQQLVSEGYLVSRERSGHFVADDVLKNHVGGQRPNVDGDDSVYAKIGWHQR